MKVLTEVTQKKRKRFNKNKKKAWRKKINISDIEEHLEDERREERLGGVLEGRVSSDLFTLDLGDEKKKLNIKRKSARFSTSKDGLKPLCNKIEKKNIHCHQFINGLPGAKAITVRKGTMKQKEKRVIQKAKKLAVPAPKADMKKKVIRCQRKVDLKKKRQIEKPDYNKNLWEKAPEIEGKFDDVSKTYLKDPVMFYKVQTKQARVKTPSLRYEKPTLIPSVIVPKPGASYNPSYDDHQKLLAEALELEKERRKKAQKKQRMREKYTPCKRELTELEKMAEMAEGLPLNADQDYEMYNFSEEENNNEDDDDNNFIANKKVEKRSMQSRKKAKTVQVKEQIRLRMKEKKRRENDLNKIKSLQRDINKEEEEAQQLKERKKRKRMKDRYRTKRLSRHDFKDNDDVVPLGNELAGSLRTVEPVGNPLESVFKSLQRRNLIDKRGITRKIKPKKIMIKKKSCKEPLNILKDL